MEFDQRAKNMFKDEKNRTEPFQGLFVCLRQQELCGDFQIQPIW